MTFKEKAVQHATQYFDKGYFKKDLAELISVKTESQNNECNLENYYDQNIIPMLVKMGFKCKVMENPLSKANIILFAERIENADFSTILTYGHGDVVLGQDSCWDNGLSPYKLIEKDNRYYGRGTADNKGQHLINIKALNSLLSVQKKLGFNFKILFEMGEEIGSPGLKAFCQQNKELLKADVFIASDGPRISQKIPTIFTGSRGGINFDLSVNLRDNAHHSGNFGGILKDPSIILSHAIASITDARGQINIPEWLPTSLTPDIKEILAKLPLVDAGFELDLDWGQKELTMTERVFGWNSFSVLAMLSGEPEAPLNAISGHARSTCQLRFVVGTDVNKIIPALRNHLNSFGFEDVNIHVSEMTPFPATRLEMNNSWLSLITKSLENSMGSKIDLLPNLGGSLPNDSFSEVLELPTIWIPHSYAGCAQHSPNEHLSVPLARQALICMTALFADLSKEEKV
ncbi:M20 family metallopeptidase [Amylibacter sp.]|nr:M20 family metallopeptidase [Amylibacter sp.]MDB2600662.1 M20 family metallopeptidase [Amylibacter sp.]